MAAKVVATAAKVLLTEDTPLIKTAVQAIRTTAVEETVVNSEGFCSGIIQSTKALFGESATKTECALQSESVQFRRLDIGPPEELPRFRARDIAEVEEDVVESKAEEKITEQITNNVPTNPNNYNPIEQGKREHRQEIGDARVTTEVKDGFPREQQPESRESGEKIQDVGEGNEGPDVGSNIKQENL